MAGPLERLIRALASGGEDAKRAQRLVGERYTQAAADTPTMFQKGQKFARGDDALGQQFGVRFERDPDFPGGFVWPNNSIVQGPGTMNEYSYQDALSGLSPNLFAHDIPNLPHGTNSRLLEFDTSGLRSRVTGSGVGEGRGVYGAMFGSLLDDPRLVNYTSVLTPRNRHRRNYNQAAALTRAPELSSQILVDPDQLPFTNSRVDPMEFLRRSPEDQIGALQSSGALQTLMRVKKTAAHPETYDDPAVHGALRAIADYTIPFEDDPMAFARAANTLRNSGAPSLTYDTVGASALRRAAVVDDIINGRSIRKSLLPGLEYRGGGAVRGFRTTGMR